MRPPDGPEFRNRLTEWVALQDLRSRLRASDSGVLVLCGEAGIGKTALLERFAASVDESRVLRTVGVQTELHLAFAGLHQLCAPLLADLEWLPAPQRRALDGAFGLGDAAAADPLFVGLAVLSLLSRAAADRPLVCVVDDAQWLDAASAQALGFVARRLGAEPVAAVIATRGPVAEEWSGLPVLDVPGLARDDSRALLDVVLPSPLDEHVRDRIIEETRGNPLALLELPRGLPPLELAGGFGVLSAQELPVKIEEAFLRRIADLPPDCRTLLLLAAADPVAERMLVLRAGQRLGLGDADLEPAVAAGLCELGPWIRFRHPLVRSAIYGSAALDERRAVHRALAEVTDPEAASDRRAWHRAQGAIGPDEDVAQDLERSAARAQGRGGLAAAAAFLERSTHLTPDPCRRAQRAMAAAEISHQAGAHDAAVRLIVTAEAAELDEPSAARLDLLRAQIALAQRRGREAPSLLLRAARRLEPLDPAAARAAYLQAFAAANLAGRLADGDSRRDVARAVRAAALQAPATTATGRLLDGLVTTIIEGRAAGAPVVHEALALFARDDLPVEEAVRWMWFASHIALCFWDYETHTALAERLLAVARESGAFAFLTTAVYTRIATHMGAGDLEQAARLLEEADAIAAADGTAPAAYVAMCLAALRGREDAVFPLTESTRAELVERGEGIGLATVEWCEAILLNALGRHAEALAAIRHAVDDPDELWFSTWGAIELIEAAARSGALDVAETAVERLAETTRASGSNLATGIEARSRALVSSGATAERQYREAIDALAKTRVRVELARAHLLYGEWLRGAGRADDARAALRSAEELFTSMGLMAFAARTARELAAVGEAPRGRPPTAETLLTAQEAQIAELARDGLSNPEIAARLIVSPRTIEYHLHKVYAKLGVSSRKQLSTVLDAEPGEGPGRVVDRVIDG